jgi:ERCC4-type nuclease
MKTIHLAYDSREQKPLKAAERHCSTTIQWHKASLETFDYCIWRDWSETEGKLVRPHFAIERKSVADFVGSWFNRSNKQNEIEKIERAARWRPRPIIYVIEGGIDDIGHYDYSRFPSGSVKPQSVVSQIDKLRYHGIQVIMAGSPLAAAYEVISLLKRRLHDKSVRHWRALWEVKE